MIPPYVVTDAVKEYFDINRINMYLNDLDGLRPFIHYCEKI